MTYLGTSQSENTRACLLIDATLSAMITSEPNNPTPSPVAQSDRQNALKGAGLVVSPNLADGEMSRHTPTPNLLSATPTSDAAQANAGLGGEIRNLDGSDDWEPFLNTANEGVATERGGRTPGIVLCAFKFATSREDFPVQTPPPRSPSSISIDGAWGGAEHGEGHHACPCAGDRIG